jgi:hypothetical protein
MGVLAVLSRLEMGEKTFGSYFVEREHAIWNG